MCGIAGSFQIGIDTGLIECLKTYIARRGPDDSGEWIDFDEGISLIHTRLSILDLSHMGKQPMVSSGGRYVLTFNGEIYNHHAIREDLTKNFGQVWRGHSDTEVLVAAFEHYGIHRTLEQCNGMFAVAIWDRKNRQLTLARDRMGEKPLYVGWCPNGGVLFSSELNSISRFPGFSQDLNPDALSWLLRFGYIPAPHSIFTHIYKIPQGRYLVLNLKDTCIEPEPLELLSKCKTYWSLAQQAHTGMMNPETSDVEVVKSTLHSKLLEATRIRMEADVPLGAFLSGGIDSSLIVGMMQRLSPRPIKTFCIGFDEKKFDESPYAEAVSNHIGSEHTTLFVTARDALDTVQQLPAIYQEPFADSSQIPTYLLCKMAREHVTVALTGDGGDELFFGYERYFKARKLWKLMGAFPHPIRALVARLLLVIPEGSWDSFFRLLRLDLNMPGFKMHRFASRLMGSGVQDFHRMLRSHWLNTANLVNGSRLLLEATPLAQSASSLSMGKDIKMMLDDQLDYLPDDVLVKVDRASMAVALETRIPMLDPDILNYSWKIPMSFKAGSSKGKLILREIITEYVPMSILDRPKMGFGVPIETWLRKELRDWAEWHLSTSNLLSSGLLNPGPIQMAWEQHKKGADWSQPLWNVLMFQSWYEENKRINLTQS